jgi:TPR repeat protein
MARASTVISACVVLATVLAAQAVAGPFEDGIAAYERNDYSNALRYWRPLADQGNPAAQSNLALMYAKGQGVPRDYVQAYVWSSLSAASGHQEGVKNRDTLARGMTPTQIADAKKRASAWKPVQPPATAQSPTPNSGASAPRR